MERLCPPARTDSNAYHICMEIKLDFVASTHELQARRSAIAGQAEAFSSLRMTRAAVPTIVFAANHSRSGLNGLG